MLMVISAIGLGVAISLVYLYRNKYKIGYNGLKLYNKFDEFMENIIDTNYVVYLVDNGDYFKEISELPSQLEHNAHEPNESDPNESDPNESEPNESDDDYPIFIEKKYYKRNVYYKPHFYDKFDIEKDSINLETTCASPIIMCSLTITNNMGILHDQYDITKMVNSFVFKDCVLILTNQDIYKKMWVMLFNTNFKSKNMYIDIDKIDNIVLKWFIILDNGDMLDSENHVLKIEGGKYIK
jgi:hypothetical protein